MQEIGRKNGSVDGIFEIEYKAQKMTAPSAKTPEPEPIPGEYYNQTYKKTVYDADVISDADMMKYGREALENAPVEIRPEGMRVSGVSSNGIHFEGWLDAFGKIKSYYPIIP